jgi:hypothetical protein
VRHLSPNTAPTASDYGTEQARRRWRDRSAPSRGRHRGSSSSGRTDCYTVVTALEGRTVLTSNNLEPVSKSKGRKIKTWILSLVLFTAVSLPSIAQSQTATPTPCSTCTVRGAPGPIVGAGLPILAIGFGAYLLGKRLRRKAD